MNALGQNNSGAEIMRAEKKVMEQAIFNTAIDEGHQGNQSKPEVRDATQA
jgi:hypothetical protein